MGLSMATVCAFRPEVIYWQIRIVTDWEHGDIRRELLDQGFDGGATQHKEPAVYLTAWPVA